MLVTFKRNITITSYFKIKVITTTNLLFTVIYYFSVTLQIEKLHASCVDPKLYNEQVQSNNDSNNTAKLLQFSYEYRTAFENLKQKTSYRCPCAMQSITRYSLIAHAVSGQRVLYK